MDEEGAGQGADAERAQQQAIDQRTAAEAVAGDERQQSQGGRRGKPKHQAAREDRAQAPGLGDVAQAGDNGAADPLAREIIRWHLAPPPQEGAGER